MKTIEILKFSIKIVLLIVLVSYIQIKSKTAEAAYWNPNSEQTLASVVPEMSSIDCVNRHLDAFEQTIISGTSFHGIKRSYDFISSDSGCSCFMSVGETIVTGTGRHWPQNALITLRLPTTYLGCVCDNETDISFCPNN